MEGYSQFSNIVEIDGEHMIEFEHKMIPHGKYGGEKMAGVDFDYILGFIILKNSNMTMQM